MINYLRIKNQPKASPPLHRINKVDSLLSFLKNQYCLYIKLCVSKNTNYHNQYKLNFPQMPQITRIFVVFFSHRSKIFWTLKSAQSAKSARIVGKKWF